MMVTDDPPVVAEPAWLESVRLRARRHALWLRFLWSSSMDGSEAGMAITHSEVDRILAPPGQTAGAQEQFLAADPDARALGEEIEAAGTRLLLDGRWTGLCRAFGLTPAESALLALAAAAEADPPLCRVYGYLLDDTSPSYATPWLATQLFGLPAGSTVGSGSALARWRLAGPLDDAGGASTTPWIADPAVVAYLLGSVGPEYIGGPWIRMEREEDLPDVSLYPDVLQAMIAFVSAASGPGLLPLEVEIVGAAGAGRRTLARQLCRALGYRCLTVDAARPGGKHLDEGAAMAGRAATLTGSVPLWIGLDRAGEDVSSVHGLAPLAVVTAEAPLDGGSEGVIRQSFRLPRSTRSMRVALWESLAGTPAPSVIEGWSLLPGEIARAALAGPAAAADVCRRLLYHDPGELFTPLPRPYTWDDLVLPPHVHAHLRELENQARLRWQVYEDWGMERLVPLGRGITALFAGPSGTGKTMAAQVLARSLDLDLYRVDLSGVMNKYIGETEKRLKAVFDRCERANVLLFFDEADALFGRRTQVDDAHDRFANIEIDYLLQRMEQFDGVAILATNRKSDLDSGFLRRLRFIVDFLPPAPAERLALWQRSLSVRAPGGEEICGEIDWPFLAENLAMTGADIKGATLSAAFLARAEARRIEMEHVLHAARREMAKHGAVLRLPEREP